MAVARGNKKISITDALASPGDAPAANRARIRSGASRGSGDARTLGPPNPSWDPTPATARLMRKLIS
eukprot:14891578-Alexandrium_andersonii.AAC.1